MYRVINGHNVLPKVNRINKNLSRFSRVTCKDGILEVIMCRLINGQDVLSPNIATSGDPQRTYRPSQLRFIKNLLP